MTAQCCGSCCCSVRQALSHLPVRVRPPARPPVRVRPPARPRRYPDRTQTRGAAAAGQRGLAHPAVPAGLRRRGFGAGGRVSGGRAAAGVRAEKGTAEAPCVQARGGMRHDCLGCHEDQLMRTRTSSRQAAGHCGGGHCGGDHEQLRTERKIKRALLFQALRLSPLFYLLHFIATCSRHSAALSLSLALSRSRGLSRSAQRSALKPRVSPL